MDLSCCGSSYITDQEVARQPPQPKAKGKQESTPSTAESKQGRGEIYISQSEPLHSGFGKGTLKPLYEELANDIGISHHGSDELVDFAMLWSSCASRPSGYLDIAWSQSPVNQISSDLADPADKTLHGKRKWQTAGDTRPDYEGSVKRD